MQKQKITSVSLLVLNVHLITFSGMKLNNKNIFEKGPKETPYKSDSKQSCALTVH